MSELRDGVYEHKTSDMTWLSVNSDFFIPDADWMEKYISSFKTIVFHSKSLGGFLLELR